MEEAFNLCYEARKTCREGYSPFSYYFVQPVLEEHLPKPVLRYFQSRLKQLKEQVLESYKGNLRQLSVNLVSAMLLAINDCEWSEHTKLNYNGGRLDGLRVSDSISIFALYSGLERVSIGLCTEEDDRQIECAVKEFQSEEEMKAWLQNKREAEATIEDKAVELNCIDVLSKEHYRHEH